MSRMNLQVGVNRRADPRNASELETKHIPVIQAPEVVRAGEPFEVRIEVGEALPHPNEPDHFIEFVELYADETYLARVSLTAGTTCPEAVLRVALGHGDFRELRAFARCNLHGMWASARPISVKG